MTTDTLDDANSLVVLDGITFDGAMTNTNDETLYAHIRLSARRGHPQVKAQAPQHDRICIVGGGPSLESTFDELRDLYFNGAKVVALNNSAQWLLERNIRPAAQVLLDARESNARFVEKPIPQCRYLIASQCHPAVWDAVEGRDVWIWHPVGPGAETVLREMYGNNFVPIGHGVVGGTTVLVRAVALFRTLGFFRFDLFGADSCVMGDAHHAYPQPENDADRIRTIGVSQPEGGEQRKFRCTGWHLKQLEDFIRMIRAAGENYLLNVHGDGLLAYALSSSAELTLETKE